MKWFAVFAYDNYYPDGGWHDLKGLFETIEEARKVAKNLRYDDKDIVDLVTGEIIE
jgi:hypothetical protein